MDRCASGRAVLRLRERDTVSRAVDAPPWSSFGDPSRRFMTLRAIPLLRGMKDGDRVRSAGAGVRWTSVLLLLALRTGGWAVPEEGGLSRPRRLRQGPG